jgi:hypothetical protein
MARLGQYYLVDMVSRGIDFRLDWHRRSQEYIFGGPSADIGEDANTPDDPHGQNKKTFLAQSFHGGRRHLQSLARKGLVIVSEIGRPTVFITVTCNQYWPEIQEALLPSQTAFDRPDIVNRVFKARLDKFLKLIRSGRYFDEKDNNGNVIRRKVIYEMRCIEYQHRGMPHCHIVMKLSNSPDLTDRPACSAWCDRHLSACLPEMSADSTEDDIRYNSKVAGHMRHTCSSGVNGCLDENGHCSKGFNDTIIRESTIFDERGKPHYKRNNDNDLNIAPHNRQMLLDWDGHCYVDFAGSSYSVLYLYK